MPEKSCALPMNSARTETLPTLCSATSSGNPTVWYDYDLDNHLVAANDNERASEAVFITRTEIEMHVIARREIRSDLDLSLARLFGEHVAINVLVAVFEKGRLSTVTQRGNVMREITCATAM